MNKVWLRGMLLGVSLALLLAGGAALAQGPSITADKGCFTCADFGSSFEPSVTGLEPENVVEFMLSDFVGDDPCFEFWVDGEPVDFWCPGWYATYWYMWAYCGEQVAFWDEWESYADDIGASHVTFPFEYGEWTVEACVSNNEGEVGAEATCAEVSVVLAEDCSAYEFVPEPGSIMLLGSGLVGLAGYATLRLRSGQALRWRTRE